MKSEVSLQEPITSTNPKPGEPSPQSSILLFKTYFSNRFEVLTAVTTERRTLSCNEDWLGNVLRFRGKYISDFQGRRLMVAYLT
jgi:hypothetical protein